MLITINNVANYLSIVNMEMGIYRIILQIFKAGQKITNLTISLLAIKVE